MGGIAVRVWMKFPFPTYLCMHTEPGPGLCSTVGFNHTGTLLTHFSCPETVMFPFLSCQKWLVLLWLSFSWPCFMKA